MKMVTTVTTPTTPEWCESLLYGTHQGQVRLGDMTTDELQTALQKESWHLHPHYTEAICLILTGRGVEPIPFHLRRYIH